ncbi:protein GVQW3-like [Teleopsis dalmanni]|uniref:protein GVQW3-like n=1 Tax=Teleopsis dalmanni TaxID=139649 RepID=UPI0018CCB624|nr:protein GVQW3-like [Teleopsis dalmanni]
MPMRAEVTPDDDDDDADDVDDDDDSGATATGVGKAYGDSSISRTQAYEWYKSFKKGREVTEDLPRSERPSTSNTEENVAKIKKIVLEDRRMTEKEIARDLNISNGSVHHILHDILGMRRVAARLVPKHLDFL